MAIDTPAKIAVVGAGPIGLEAALYARFLGYDVVILERGEVAQSVRDWGHLRMFSPFGMSRSPLGLAALDAQDESYQPPPDDALITGHEWIERYLAPLSRSDLLADHLRTQTTVVAISKEDLLQGDLPGNPDRGDWSFRLLVRDAAGQERTELADAVIDASGVFTRANWLGHGGAPAAGELAWRNRIEYRLPDILGADRERYAGRHTLLIGGGHSAATNLVALADLARDAMETEVTWITRREGPAGAGGPLAAIANDPLPARAGLARQANALAGDRAAGVTWWPATVVERIVGRSAAEGRSEFEVELSGRHAGT
jgi:cation diffusion facilitator CzcD-associated flavoprotein CzcO